jgi:hypothetical protein
MLVTMGLAPARAIAAALLGRPADDPDDPGFDELELSALLIETRIGGIGPEQLGRLLFLPEPGARAAVLERLGV